MKLSVAEQIKVRDETEGYPAGQRILKMGYQAVTEEDLRKHFACDAIEDSENDRRKAVVRDKFMKSKKINQKEFDKKFVVKADDENHMAYDDKKWKVYEKRESGAAFAKKLGVPDPDTTAILPPSATEVQAEMESRRRVTTMENETQRLTVMARRAAEVGNYELENSIREDLYRIHLQHMNTLRPTLAEPPQTIAGFLVESSDRSNPLTGGILSRDMSTSADESIFESVVKCSLKKVDLESYMDEIIPPRVMSSYKIARKVGFTRFEVVYPFMENVKQPDPVLVGKFDDKMFEIDIWE